MAGTSTAITMAPGMSIDIDVPVDLSTGQGEFQRPATDEVKIGGVVVPHTLGFVSEFPAVGTIEPAEGSDLKVTYTHIQSKPNRIFFFTNDNDQHTISIVSMPIHDHSSMYQGGPAYGTYAYDKIIEEETTEE